jgi:signal transduction histidine kinase
MTPSSCSRMTRVDHEPTYPQHVTEHRRRSLAFDAGLALVVCALVVDEAFTGAMATHRQGPAWAQALGYAIPALVLALRRVRPLACLAVVCGAMAVEFAVVGSPEGFGVVAAPSVAAYTVARYEERRRSLWAFPILVGYWAAWSGFDPVHGDASAWFSSAVWLSVWVIAWLVGALVRVTGLYVAGLAKQREQRALAAVAEERNRIARELHDVIGHSVSVMTVQASAVRRLMRPDQAREREALETVEATGREALSEMRRMVGVLRGADSAPDLAPPPSLAQLGRLAEQCRRAGLEVEIEVTGDPASLPPGLDLTVYRLVQEALTNTLKHAGAAHALVRIDHREDLLELVVRDDGRGPSDSDQPGSGLLGMRERVAVYGGTLATRTAPGGGYDLRVELPLVTS